MTNIIKVPGINGLGKTSGCEDAPNEILKALESIHSNEQGNSIDTSILNIDEIHLNNEDVESLNEPIYKQSFESFQKNRKTIFLGGDHSISYPLTRAFFDYAQNSGKEPCIIIFDAHVDCMQPMKEPTHEEWLRALIKDKFPTENILLVGTRNAWKDEQKFIKEKNIKTIFINQLLLDIQDTCDIIMEFSRGKELYVSIDIDVLDPAFAPGTGYPESGGLTSRQFIYLIQRINKIQNLRAIDIVEINPKKDITKMTIKLGAKILSELI